MTDVKIIADSIYKERGMEFRTTSFELTFPRIILSEFNTHRMFSRNTSSSRAIPFNKMVEVVQKNPFIPIAWQKDHKGMQGSEYINEVLANNNCKNSWLKARDNAVQIANSLNKDSGVTKQLCNRLLEPFSWVKMVVTAETIGLNNFFKLRCPKYEYYDMLTGTQQFFKSKKDWLQYYNNKPLPKAKHISKIPENDVEWLQINKSQTEIHMQQLAEMMYDACNESIPKELKAGEWHIPFGDKINLTNQQRWDNSFGELIEADIKVATAMCARTSYTTIDDEKELDLIKLIKLHDKLIDLNHSSPLEHCRRAMTSDELYGFMKATPFKITETNALIRSEEYGVCEYSRGFIPYRYLVENKKL